MKTDGIKVYVLRGGGLLLVAPDGRQETVMEPMVADGASVTQVREYLALHREMFDHAIDRLTRIEIDLARESSSTIIGSGA